jgi:hypothetical protein
MLQLNRLASNPFKTRCVSTLTEVSFVFDRLKSFEAALTAARIVSVTPKGKASGLFDLNNGRSIGVAANIDRINLRLS